jgi:hypothetical protein
MPPYTVLKVSKNSDIPEVMGEWESEDEATSFAEDARQCDPDCEYLVERPPGLPPTDQVVH